VIRIGIDVGGTSPISSRSMRRAVTPGISNCRRHPPIRQSRLSTGSHAIAAGRHFRRGHRLFSATATVVTNLIIEGGAARRRC
jgi:hypothetical protein